MKDIFLILLHTNTLNFLILVAVFCVILWKMDIKSLFIKIQNEIKIFVEKSENEKSLALKELQRTEKELEVLPEELENIIQTAKESAVNIAQNIQKELDEEIHKIEESTESAIQFETKKFQDFLTNLTGEASVDLAQNNAIKQLAGNKELHNKYINEAIDELDKVNF